MRQLFDYEKLHSLAKRKAMNPPAVKSLPKFSGYRTRLLPLSSCRMNIAAAKTYRDAEEEASRKQCWKIVRYSMNSIEEMKAVSQIWNQDHASFAERTLEEEESG